MRKKIGVITGTRAEYGLLKPLLEKICKDEELTLQLVVTGMHLSPEFGLTYKQIEKDGFQINEKIEILLSSDSAVGINKSMGLAMISFAECFERLKPDLIIVLGDRYEIFAAASAAMMSRVPIAHLHGGEITEGAVDDAIRHSISKMSYLHFTSTIAYRKRVIQLGEAPERVFNEGAIGVENIKSMELLEKEILEEQLQFKFDQKTALVTFHPVTLENATAAQQFSALLEALDEEENLKCIFTKANSDPDGRVINQMIDEYVNQHRNKSIAFHSMGQLRFLSAMNYSSMVIGNSSSGIIEAPSFRVPTVNIGDRQKGRLQAKSVINCREDKEDIERAIKKALSEEFNKELLEMRNPYEGIETSESICRTIKEYLMEDKIMLKKKFYDYGESETK